ncbi:OmpA family protein [Psychromonas sp. MME2]|uniref:OmpA family protein n=1 Tax=Psychromonas sp. MME2 TaxID=3231033 RepID=UPI00339C1320
MTDEAKTVLNILANNLMRQPKKAVVIGFSSNTGDAKSNLMLSQKRAESVVAYLVSKGVDGNLLLATGYGQAYPIASNDTAEGRTANQRVEIKYLNQ